MILPISVGFFRDALRKPGKRSSKRNCLHIHAHVSLPWLPAYVAQHIKMSGPPNQVLTYNRNTYQHPARVIDTHQLIDLYANCGVLPGHTRCLRCGTNGDLQHRQHWLTGCKGTCLCCGRGPFGKPKHQGQVSLSYRTLRRSLTYLLALPMAGDDILCILHAAVLHGTRRSIVRTLGKGLHARVQCSP